VQAALERLLALVRRELGADEARLLEAGEELNDDPHELRCRLVDGRGIVARFAVAPADRETKQRRLEMLASTFDGVVEEVPRERRTPPPVGRSLHEELEALAERSVALNAIVIDARSPIVWGAARPEGILVKAPVASSARVSADSHAEEAPEAHTTVVSRHAMATVRGLPELAALRKGKHVRHVEGGGETPLIAHSFAGIYLLIVVFGAPFDELRAERAILEALPRIERLVLALPPLDPEPYDGAGVVAMRRGRRR